MTRHQRCTGGSTPDACNREPTGVRDGEPMCAEHMRIWDEIFSFTQKKPVGSYPHEPGHKGGGASKVASVSMSAKAKTLRQKCREYLKANGPAGADKIAAELGEHHLDIRPRCSELVTMGEAIKSDKMDAITVREKPAHSYILTSAGRSVLEQLREAA